MKRFAYFLLIAATATSLHAGNTVSLAHVYEDLSKNNQPWHETSLQLTHDFAPRHSLSGGATRTERFGQEDTQFNAGYVRPLNEKLTATLELNTSPTHEVLARNTIGALLQYEFAPAWLVHAGVKTTLYDEVRVNQAQLALENYVSNFSWSVGWRPSYAFGTTVHTGELRGNYYYRDKSSVSLALAAGEEASSIGPRVVITDIRTAALFGRHWMDPKWAIVYSVGSTRQGDFYTRNGVSVGVQYAY